MRTLLVLIQLLVADRQLLMVENLALRHQLAVLKRADRRRNEPVLSTNSAVA